MTSALGADLGEVTLHRLIVGRSGNDERGMIAGAPERRLRPSVYCTARRASRLNVDIHDIWPE